MRQNLILLKCLFYEKKLTTMKIKLFFTIGLTLILSGSISWSQITTFDYTGSMQTYTVPPGVTEIQIECWGAQGGASGICGGALDFDGGHGGYAIGNLTVTPGEDLYIFVGENPEGNPMGYAAGGFNGGGDSQTYGGPGGGASDVRQGGSTLDDRVIVAGGGGGGNNGCPDHGDGGDGGGLSGVDGVAFYGFDPGEGGTQVAGGAGYGGAGSGSFGQGGHGISYHMGGGGGGWYGGGGAYASGSGGGSSYIDGVTDGETTVGVREGHGQVIIEVLCTPITVTVSDDVICLGESFTLEGSGLGTISWDGGVENGVPFTPATSGVFTYTASSDDGGDCVYALDIEVIALPVVVATADETEICLGESVILSGSGADTYSWDMGVTDGVAFEPGVGTEIYTVTGTDAGTGCENTDEIEVIVNDLPAVVANASDTEICLGESFTLTGSGATTYVWTPDGTLDGEEITPEATGTTTYEVTGTDDNGCVNESSIDITVYEALTITYTTIDETLGSDGEIDITVTGGNPDYSFDWNNDGTGDFDDSEDLTGLSGGDYTVVVNCSAGCAATETVTVNSQLSLEGEQDINLSVFPNPSTDVVTISLDGSFIYSIVDLNGKVLCTENGINQVQLDLSDYADGVYLLEIKTENTNKTVQLIKE